MRDILFHGKRKDTGEWVEGCFCQNPTTKTTFIVALTAAFAVYEVDTSTASEFSGLPDKNGKRIFEGDICRVVRNGVPLRGVVEFFRGAFGLRYDTGEFNSFVYLNRLESTGSVFSTIEVIGNIHDNPELLEVEW